MADQCPNKNDMQLIFKRLRTIPTNKVCFDCNAKNPTWASVTYGVFICIDCSAVHRSLGVHLSFVRSTQLDTNWTWLQLRQMQLGGNANGQTFFRQHNCTTTDAQQKYNSRAAQLYREKLHQMAVQAMRLHGTKLHLESAHDNQNEESKEEPELDFFSEHTSAESTAGYETFSNISLQASHKNLLENANGGKTVGPNVEAALSGNGSQDRKPMIGMRKPQSKKAGLGAKKVGLGAQKVKTNFAEIEREATLSDQLRVQQEEDAKIAAEKLAEEEQKQMASMRLAYQDLSLKQKKEEEKLKQIDPQKAQQMERLGMGFASRTGVSHSAVSDMKIIEQENPNKIPVSKSKGSFGGWDTDSFYDDFHNSNNFSMRFSSDPKNLDFMDVNPTVERILTKDWVITEPEGRQPSSTRFPSNDRPTTKRETVPPAASTGNEAQKKFGSAKAISSDQYFGDSADNNWERKANLSRFEGSSSISSEDYFGNNSSLNNRSGFSNPIQAPDLDDVKESVRQGVTKVAGKLSSLANGVLSSIQDRYGY